MVNSEKRNTKIIRLPMKILSQWLCLSCLRFFTSKERDNTIKCTYCNSDSFFWDDKLMDVMKEKKSKKEIKEIVLELNKKEPSHLKKIGLKELNSKLKNTRKSKHKYLMVGQYRMAAKFREEERNILEELNEISQKVKK